MANFGLRVGSVTPRLFQVLTASPSLVNANSLSVETYTLTGLQTDMAIHVNQQVTQTGLVLLHGRCSAVNVLELTWFNGTGAGITPTAGQFIQVIGY